MRPGDVDQGWTALHARVEGVCSSASKGRVCSAQGPPQCIGPMVYFFFIFLFITHRFFTFFFFFFIHQASAP